MKDIYFLLLRSGKINLSLNRYWSGVDKVVSRSCVGRYSAAFGCVVLSILATPWNLAFADESRLDSLSVPEGFEVVSAVEPGLTAYPMFMNFDDRGRLYIAESTGKDLSGIEMADDPECRILRLEDTDGDGVFDTRTVFATQVGFPMGVLWHNDALFVVSPPEYLRFEDTNDDGIADSRTVLQSGWKTKHTDGSHGPYLGPDGRLYITQGLHGFEVETKDAGVFKGQSRWCISKQY